MTSPNGAKARATVMSETVEADPKSVRLRQRAENAHSADAAIWKYVQSDMSDRPEITVDCRAIEV